MKVSKGKLLDATPAMDWVRAQSKATETSFKMSRQLRVFGPVYQALGADESEIRREYTLIDEDTGRPVTTVLANGQVGTKLTDPFGYEDAIEELRGEEVEISVKPLQKSFFEKTFKKCESGHLMTLVDIGFVEDPDAPKETPTKKVDDDEDEEDDEDADAPPPTEKQKAQQKEKDSNEEDDEVKKKGKK